MSKKVALCTLGCKVNTYESEAVRQQFEKHGYVSVDFWGVILRLRLMRWQKSKK